MKESIAAVEKRTTPRLKVFEPWFTTKLEGEGAGAGLGLALVKELVERSGGNIQVESKLGVGTSFILDLKK